MKLSHDNYFLKFFAGITEVANDEHARDFPLMNGIRERLKTLTVLEASSPDRSQALLRLSVKLRTLQVFLSSISNLYSVARRVLGYKIALFVSVFEPQL